MVRGSLCPTFLCETANSGLLYQKAVISKNLCPLSQFPLGDGGGSARQWWWWKGRVGGDFTRNFHTQYTRNGYLLLMRK